jgi:hypothetical protein
MAEDWHVRRDQAVEFFKHLAFEAFEPESDEGKGFIALVDRILLIENEAEYIRFMEFGLQVQREMLSRLSKWGLN